MLLYQGLSMACFLCSFCVSFQGIRLVFSLAIRYTDKWNTRHIL